MLTKEKLINKLKSPELYLYGLLFGCLGAITNIYLTFDLYGQLTLHLGQSFVLFCLLSRGFSCALIAAAITNGSLWYLTDNPYFFLTLNLELLFLGLMLRKKFWLLSADIIYWLLIGLPITYTILLFANLPADFNIMILSKQLLNGVMYTIIAIALNYFAPQVTTSSLPDRKREPLSKIIFRLSVVTIVLPSLIIALSLTQKSVSQFERTTVDKLFNHATELETIIEQYIVRHQVAIDALASTLNYQLSTDEQQKLLNNYLALYPGFISMLIANSQAEVTHGAPNSFYQNYLKLPKNEHLVTDREYFKYPKETLTPYISKVFQGRGFGSDMIIGISSPIIINDEFQGIAEGSLNLPKFGEFEYELLGDNPNEFILILDSNKKVIYQSMPEKEMVDGFFEALTQERAPNAKPFEIVIDGKKYLYQVTENERGWQLFVFQSSDVITTLITDNFYVVLLSLFTIIVLFLFLARTVSERLTTPLVQFIEQFSQLDKGMKVNLPADSPAEFAFLTKKINHAHNLQRNYQQHLASEVEEKTKQLQHLNFELELKARTDGLTGLLNRNSFDELAENSFQLSQREKLPCAIAMLDIDHFKKVNDLYGHLTGDTCIITLAEKLKAHFKRNTDLIARFGGEEFIVFVKGDEQQINEKFESYRKLIEKEIFTHEETLFQITVSIGVCHLSPNATIKLVEAVNLADEQLYHSKANGRNQLTGQKIS
ncbi:sensor domain-containing diguanylate cyclase [Thalassotalea eurytherma]|uniref:diguanylate cyclase n=1 Tax=Thalassotalea eurytherma TaxID=1144278 RepID=A0ABQ6GZU6_9GAMM|nr:diguanylate cyclase [Thalassotalea eurytherma]GLX81164.1 hypothetical protein theurythT_06160 [Thalassotalea eurytherma]